MFARLRDIRLRVGALLYAVHRSKDDSHVFWTTEVYAAEDVSAHPESKVQAAASRPAVAYASSSGRKALALPTNRAFVDRTQACLNFRMMTRRKTAPPI